MIGNEFQSKKADVFLKLHYEPKILLLPNAWDVITTKIYEQLGFKAIGTTSAGIAATLGYPDGEVMTLEENLNIVKRILNHTTLPISDRYQHQLVSFLLMFKGNPLLKY